MQCNAMTNDDDKIDWGICENPGSHLKTKYKKTSLYIHITALNIRESKGMIHVVAKVYS